MNHDRTQSIRLINSTLKKGYSFSFEPNKIETEGVRADLLVIAEREFSLLFKPQQIFCLCCQCSSFFFSSCNFSQSHVLVILQLIAIVTTQNAALNTELTFKMDHQQTAIFMIQQHLLSRERMPLGKIHVIPAPSLGMLLKPHQLRLKNELPWRC